MEGKKNTKKVLRKIGEYHYSFQGTPSALSAPYLQKILKIVRESEDDPKLMAGITISLSNSQILGIANKEEILKLLSSSFSVPQSAKRLFSQLEPKNNAQKQKLIKISKKIVHSSTKYPVLITQEASKRLEKIKSQNLEPIYELEKELKIYQYS